MRLLAPSLLLVLGCNGASGPDLVAPAITVFDAGTTSVSVARGDIARLLFSVERSQAYTKPVTLAVESAPPGLVASFGPSTIDIDKGLSELTISASTSLEPGVYDVVVAARGTAIESKRVTVTVTVTQPTIALSASQTNVTVEQGSSVAAQLSVARGGGYRGTVVLSMTGVPSGVTATFSPTALGEGETAVVLTLAPGLDVPTGTTQITVRAAGPVVSQQSLPLQFTVAATTVPAIKVTATPVSLTVIQGTSSNIDVQIVRYAAYDGAVSIAAEGLPAGITASALPIAGDQSQTTLVLSAANDAPPTGPNVPFVIRATGNGIASRTVNAAIRVAEAPTFRFQFSSGQGGQPVSSWSGTVTRGASVPVLGEVLRVSGFNEPIAVSMLNMPTGITATGLPATVTAGTGPQVFPFTIHAAESTVPGVHTMTLRGVSAVTGLTVETTAMVTVQ